MMSAKSTIFDFMVYFSALKSGMPLLFGAGT